MSAPIDHRQVQGDIALVAYASEGTISGIASNLAFAALDGTWNTHYQNGSEVTLTGADEITISENGWYEIAARVLIKESTAQTFVAAAITHNELLIQLAAAPSTDGGTHSVDVELDENTVLFTAHREYKLGDLAEGFVGEGDISFPEDLSLLWSGYAQAGDTFRIVVATVEFFE